MVHTYVAYIDESGDDGLSAYREPGGRGGSSNWLVISALLYRAAYDLDAVHWRDEITAQMPEKKSRNLHFAKLKHGQRLVATRAIATKPVRAISVVSYKRGIQAGTYTEKNQLYSYLTRYLIERISWLCRDLRPRAKEGDGRVHITFSRRGGMSYDDFRRYLFRLKENTKSDDIRIHWPVIDIDAIAARDHSSRAGLQLVDSVASAFACAVEPDPYGNCENRYAEILRPITYHRNHNYFSYGLKFLPRRQTIPFNREQLRLINQFEEKRQPPGP